MPVLSISLMQCGRREEVCWGLLLGRREPLASEHNSLGQSLCPACKVFALAELLFFLVSLDLAACLLFPGWGIEDGNLGHCPSDRGLLLGTIVETIFLLREKLSHYETYCCQCGTGRLRPQSCEIFFAVKCSGRIAGWCCCCPHTIRQRKLSVVTKAGCRYDAESLKAWAVLSVLKKGSSALLHEEPLANTPL